jgi:maltokinase
MKVFRKVTPGRNPDVEIHRVPGHDLDLEAHSTLFSGEQSNSSVAFGDDSLMKVFRKITPGSNPDISIHEVLTRAGSDHVAALYGWLDTSASEDESEGDPDGPVLELAMLQQFLRTASDGWDLALASVRNLFAEADLHADEVGGDFAAESARLGEALAETHRSLAEHFPVEDRSSEDLAALAAAMDERLDAALAVVPDLAPYADDLRRSFAAVRELPGVRVQRIHGDLHLGQTLRTVRGWKIVDFEGEPAKPLAERALPDSPWRDVAGMLRSFDYAPRVVERTWGEDLDDATEQRSYRAGEWSDRNREAFLTAYASRDLTAEERTLLEAYVADKAVYETVYETRNRPAWVGIPLAAVARIGVS